MRSVAMLFSSASPFSMPRKDATLPACFAAAMSLARVAKESASGYASIMRRVRSICSSCVRAKPSFSSAGIQTLQNWPASLPARRRAMSVSAGAWRRRSYLRTSLGASWYSRMSHGRSLWPSTSGTLSRSALARARAGSSAAAAVPAAVNGKASAHHTAIVSCAPRTMSPPA